jgi:hypothetical protein
MPYQLAGLDMEMFRDVYLETNPELGDMNDAQLQKVYNKCKQGLMHLKPPHAPEWMSDKQIKMLAKKTKQTTGSRRQ